MRVEKWIILFATNCITFGETFFAGGEEVKLADSQLIDNDKLIIKKRSS